MALKIRLRQQGRNNRPFYRVVLTDVRSPRDGKYLEAIGWYNPFESEQDKNLNLDAARLQYWLDQGAEISECVEALVEKGAPSILRQYRSKVVARRAKDLSKRRARKAAKAKA
jgi:small subunit ribosomal protein S16